MTTRGRVIGLAVGVVVALAGSGCVGGPTGEPPRQLSAHGYAQQLNIADAALDAQIAKISQTGSLDTLAHAVSEVGEVAYRVSDDLSRVTLSGRPADHDRLLAGLRQFSGAIPSLAREVNDRKLCAPSSVLPAISSAPGAQQARTAAAALGSPDFLLAAPELPRRRLPNGTLIGPPLTGEGELTVDNNIDVDSLVTVAAGGRLIAGMYLHARQKATMVGIPDGIYEAFVSSGVDFDEATRLFTRSCTSFRYDTTFDYRTTAEDVTAWEVGVAPSEVVGVSTEDVDPYAVPR